MRLWVPVMALLLSLGAFAGERHKIDIDPESQDGILLQRIRQEPLVPRKLALLEKYVAQYPQTSSTLWVYDQLLPIYLDAGQDDQALRVAEKVLVLDPDDLGAAHTALQIAERKKDAELIRKYSGLSWDLASKFSKTRGPADPDDAADWSKQLEFCKQVMAYVEYKWSSQAIEESDPAKRAELIAELEKRNPESKYLATTKRPTFRNVSFAVTSERSLAETERTLADDPDNEDLLMAVAEYLMGQERDLQRVLNYSLRALELLQKKTKPDEVSAEAWESKRSRYTGAANWMVGVIYGKQGRYGLSERHLHAALPLIRDNGQLLAAAYFYLGYDNYAMAGELRDRGRALEAMKYNKLCTSINGPFQPLAEKNMDVIRSEYNLR